MPGHRTTVMILPDISKALVDLHPRFYVYLAGLMPGLFFEISLLAVRPAPILEAASRAHLGYNASAADALFLAFIIGSAAILWVTAIRISLRCAFTLRRFLWRTFLDRLFRAKSFPQKPAWAMSNRWLIKCHQQQAMALEGLQGIQRVWSKAATGLLKRRYGISPPQGDNPLHQAEVNAWYSVLTGNPSAEELRGNFFVIALHATGWCGIAAIYVTPSLRNDYYIGLCLFLVAYGTYQEFSLARWWSNPVTANI